MADARNGRKRKAKLHEQKQSSQARLPAKKRKTTLQERSSEFAESIFSETSYYTRNGLRCVVPYYFTFTSYAKGRWLGSTVFDVFCKEFQSENPKYYEFAIKSGKVTVNDVIATMETKIKDNDIIGHRIHRHEPPVSAGSIPVVYEDQNVIVVNKPSSIPVHPCGRYRHNTVLYILSKERGLRNLKTAHRLDRLTSGLLIIAKNLETAQKLEFEIRNRDIQKEYVCRVKGKFPEGEVECSESILVVSHKLGVCKVDPNGKPCCTLFTRLFYNGTTSVVRCLPKTGRMHQIRVHLQWQGYPIVNDPLYGSKAWGPHGGKGGKGTEDMDQVIEHITKESFSSENCTDSSDAKQSTLPVSPEEKSGFDNSRKMSTHVANNSPSRMHTSAEFDSLDRKCASPDRKCASPDRKCASPDRKCVSPDRKCLSPMPVETVSDPESRVSALQQIETSLPADSMQSESSENTEDDHSREDNKTKLDLGSARRKLSSEGQVLHRQCVSSEDDSHLRHRDLNREELASIGDGEKTTTSIDYARQTDDISAVDDGELASNETDGELCQKIKPSSSSSARGLRGAVLPLPPSALVKSDRVLLSTGPQHPAVVDPDCTECRTHRPDPSPRDLVMYLHAICYKGSTWEYRTEGPAWAEESFREPL